MLEQDRADETNDGLLVGEDADRISVTVHLIGTHVSGNSRLVREKGLRGRIKCTVTEIVLYAGTVEDDVYTALSQRFGDIFSVLGQLPDAFEDDWIAAVLNDRAAVRNFSQRVEMTKPPMQLRYNQDMDDRGLDWEYTERVLSSRDLDEWMRQGW